MSDARREARHNNLWSVIVLLIFIVYICYATGDKLCLTQ